MNCSEESCDKCEERFTCYTNPELRGEHFTIEKEARLLMVKHDIPLPKRLHCNSCGRKAEVKIRCKWLQYDKENGEKSALLEAIYRCPHFPHSLASFYSFYLNTRRKNKEWDDD
jgi:hypothetical protein